jgi:hypothetical protein
LNNPAANAKVTSLVQCGVGKVILGGGYKIAVSGNVLFKDVIVVESYPVSTNQWQVVAVAANTYTGQGTNNFTVQAYALCSK